MAKAWTKIEKNKYKKELQKLYIKQNLSIKEIGKILDIAEQTVFGVYPFFRTPSLFLIS